MFHLVMHLHMGMTMVGGRQRGGALRAGNVSGALSKRIASPKPAPPTLLDWIARTIQK